MNEKLFKSTCWLAAMLHFWPQQLFWYKINLRL